MYNYFDIYKTIKATYSYQTVMDRTAHPLENIVKTSDMWP